MLDKRMSCEPNGTEGYINKINGKLKLLYRKTHKRHLTKELDRIFYNALIHQHFDYAHPAWYPNLKEKTKVKIQIMQNK